MSKAAELAEGPRAAWSPKAARDQQRTQGVHTRDADSGHEGSEVTPGPLNQSVLVVHVITDNVWQENNGNTGYSRGQDWGDPLSPREASKAPCETVKH